MYVDCVGIQIFTGLHSQTGDTDIPWSLLADWGYRYLLVFIGRLWIEISTGLYRETGETDSHWSSKSDWGYIFTYLCTQTVDTDIHWSSRQTGDRGILRSTLYCRLCVDTDLHWSFGQTGDTDIFGSTIYGLFVDTIDILILCNGDLLKAARFPKAPVLAERKVNFTLRPVKRPVPALAPPWLRGGGWHAQGVGFRLTSVFRPWNNHCHYLI